MHTHHHRDSHQDRGHVALSFVNVYGTPSLCEPLIALMTVNPADEGTGRLGRNSISRLFPLIENAFKIRLHLPRF